MSKTIYINITKKFSIMLCRLKIVFRNGESEISVMNPKLLDKQALSGDATLTANGRNGNIISLNNASEEEEWISIGTNNQPVKVEEGETHKEAAERVVKEKEAEREKESNTKKPFPRGALSGKQVKSFLESDGFKVVKNRGKQSGKGSHVKMRGPNGEITHVPIHRNESMGKGLLDKIKKQAGYK